MFEKKKKNYVEHYSVAAETQIFRQQVLSWSDFEKSKTITKVLQL